MMVQGTFGPPRRLSHGKWDIVGGNRPLIPTGREGRWINLPFTTALLALLLIVALGAVVRSLPQRKLRLGLAVTLAVTVAGASCWLWLAFTHHPWLWCIQSVVQPVPEHVNYDAPEARLPLPGRSVFIARHSHTEAMYYSRHTSSAVQDFYAGLGPLSSQSGDGDSAAFSIVHEGTDYRITVYPYGPRTSRLIINARPDECQSATP